MVSCCDSRVDPYILFDAEPGDIFVIRNVANLVPPFESGHANCGGIRALMENDTAIEPDGFVDRWMRIAASAKDDVLKRSDLHTTDQRTSACERTAVRLSLRNLLSYTWIRSRVESGDLEMAGLFYDLRSGEIEQLGEISLSTP